MRSFFSLMNRFRRDRRGNIAVIFAVATVPLISAIGCAIDYSEAARIKAKLQSAADAAAVASISQRSQGWLAASTMTTNGPVPVAETDATNIFNGNINATVNQLFTLNTAGTNAVVTKTGATLTATVNFSADVPVTFMKVAGFTKLTVSGVSAASATMPLYLDFYLALDVSASMGLPSTSTPNGGEAKRLQDISPDNKVQYPTGCTLACHFAQPPLNNLKASACIDPSPNTPTGASPTQQYPTGNYCLGYEISRISQSAYAKLLSNHGGQLPAYKYTSKSSPPAQVTQPTAFYSTNTTAYPNDPIFAPVSSCPTPGTDACIQLRLDAVGMAVNQLLALANTKQVIANQFRIGLYPFIEDADTNYAPLTYSFTGSAITTAANNLAQELDTNTNSTLKSGGTHIDVALHTINSQINAGVGSVGNGSSPTSTLPYVFLVTDGAQDPQTKGVPFGSWSGSNHAVTLGDASNQYATICTTLKNRGIIVSVLNVPYQPINPVNSSFANDEDDYANNNITGPPGIKTSLQNCASPPDSGGSYYYEGNTPDEINTALQAMFNHSIQTAHITN
ncbi:MAG: TadE/TadG family type IV pilus assembly protein [Bradyrhizobium sp.]